MEAKKTFVTTAQLSAITGLSEAWLRSEALAGRLPHLRVNDRIKFNPALVEQALLSRAGETIQQGGVDAR